MNEVTTLIKSKLSERTNEQLILDAKVARLNKSEESQRMIFALIMDTLYLRLPEEEFENIYDQLISL
jgi:hypothetical protein